MEEEDLLVVERSEGQSRCNGGRDISAVLVQVCCGVDMVPKASWLGAGKRCPE